MQYLVTGGCGFIGSHIAEALLGAGHEVRILDNLSSGFMHNAPASAEVRIGDVGDAQAVAAALEGMDGCFHMAAVASVEKSTQHWAETHRTNQTGVINVLEAARGRPVIWASSAAIYGPASEIPIREDAPKAPMSPYGADKFGAELHGATAALLFDTPNTALRFFNVYGPRQDPKSPYSGVIAIFADRLAGGHGITIHGDGEQVRDFVFVADVVAANLAAMQRLETRIAAGEAALFDAVNICTGRATSVNTLAAVIADILGVQAEVIHGPERGGDIRESIGCPDEMRQLLGGCANIGLKEGLAILLKNYETAASA